MSYPYKPNDEEREFLKMACLVIRDADLRRGITSIDEISTDSVNYSFDDIGFAQVVIYDGKFGQKVLKMRHPKVYRHNGKWTHSG